MNLTKTDRHMKLGTFIALLSALLAGSSARSAIVLQPSGMSVGDPYRLVFRHVN